MATSVIMPRQGQSVESCILSKWNKKPGDAVKIGDLLFSYETDKASFEEESKVDGILLVRLCEENDDVPCLVEVCRVGTEAEWNAQSATGAAATDTGAPSVVHPSASGTVTAPAEAPFQTTSGLSSAQAVEPATILVAHVLPVSTFPVSAVDAPAPTGNDGSAVSPRARRLAENTGVNPAFAIPTGPGGRVLERDIVLLRDAGVRLTPTAASSMLAGSIEAGTLQGTGLGGRITAADLTDRNTANTHASVESGVGTGAGVGRSTDMQEIANGNMRSAGSQGAEATGFRDVPLPNIRKVIAKAMFQSISTTCQLTLNASFDASALLALRTSFKQAVQPEAAGITLTDMILFAVSRTLLSHPNLNAHFLDDRMRLFEQVNLGLAVDTERGLMVPTLFGAEAMTLAELSVAAKAAAKECQTGKINPDKLKDGTFTVSNLGTFGVESFTPVLNAPQTGILGVCSIQTKVREGRNGLESYPSMGLSLTFDHRAIDGAPAARFLKDLIVNLEQFAVLLAL